MIIRSHFDNPMLTGLRSRRRLPTGASRRIEARGVGRGRGSLVAAPSTAVHLHRRFAVSNQRCAPVVRLALTVVAQQPRPTGRERIESHLVWERGPVAEVLRLVTPSAAETARQERVRDQRITVRDMAESTVERGFRRRQRIESRRDTSIVMRERQSVGIEVERALDRVASSRDVPDSRRFEPESLPASRQGSTPVFSDLDRLTDQIVNRIDDRLIAHRERMGTRY